MPPDCPEGGGAQGRTPRPSGRTDHGRPGLQKESTYSGAGISAGVMGLHCRDRLWYGDNGKELPDPLLTHFGIRYNSFFGKVLRLAGFGQHPAGYEPAAASGQGVPELDAAGEKLQGVLEIGFCFGQKVRVVTVVDDGAAQASELQAELVFFSGTGD